MYLVKNCFVVCFSKVTVTGSGENSKRHIIAYTAVFKENVQISGVTFNKNLQIMEGGG